MLEILKFVTRDFWTFVAVFLLLSVPLAYLAEVIRCIEIATISAIKTPQNPPESFEK